MKGVYFVYQDEQIAAVFPDQGKANSFAHRLAEFHGTHPGASVVEGRPSYRGARSFTITTVTSTINVYVQFHEYGEIH